MGVFEDISSDISETNPVSVNLSGFTENKLSQIRGYDYDSPYTVGVNGVSEINNQYIKYTIGLINYITNLTTLETVFSFTTIRNEYTTNQFIHNDKNLDFVDKMMIDSSINITRQKLSVIESFSKLRQIGGVDELNNFGNKFYNISNQSV